MLVKRRHDPFLALPLCQRYASGYASDLTEAQWQLLEPLLPPSDPAKGGRPRKHTHRDILDALFYIEKTGCQWRMLPREFPHWNLVWQYFRRWRDDGTLEALRLALNKQVRHKAGKETLPSVALVTRHPKTDPF